MFDRLLVYEMAKTAAVEASATLRGGTAFDRINDGPGTASIPAKEAVLPSPQAQEEDDDDLDIDYVEA